MQEKTEIKKQQAATNILFFDGLCVLCNTSINFFMSIDKKNRLSYAPLQGITANNLLQTKDLDDITTIVYLSGDRSYKHSDAAIRSLASIGGSWKLVLIFLMVPKLIRDKIYRFISSHRYSWFGKKEVCRTASSEDRNKILP